MVTAIPPNQNTRPSRPESSGLTKGSRPENNNEKQTGIEYLLSRPQFQDDLNIDPDDQPYKKEADLALKATASFIKSKGYSHKLMQRLFDLASIVSPIQNLLIRAIDYDARRHAVSEEAFQADGIIEEIVKAQGWQNFLDSGDEEFAAYDGKLNLLTKVNRAIFEARQKQAGIDNEFEERQKTGIGAARKADLNSARGLSFHLAPKMREAFQLPIVIVGGGPAAIMATRFLIEAGFDNRKITVLDESGEYKGVWKKKCVHKGMFNNPFDVDFFGVKLNSSKGKVSTGEQFLAFLDQIIKGDFPVALPQPLKAQVKRIEPGEMNHKVTYIDRDDNQEKTMLAPIVINATGLGLPVNFKKTEGRMQIEVQKKSNTRWQKYIDEETAEKYRNKDLLLIGMGNSTIEMLLQIQKLNEQGYNIKYKVLTDYPQDSIDQPDEYIESNGRKYRVFRDLTVSNLIDVEGDIDDAREAYFKALKDGNIIADVTKVSNPDSNNKDEFIIEAKGKSIKLNCDKLFTLIGYKQNKTAHAKMGVSSDSQGNPLIDFDGEVQKPIDKQNENDRTYKGYS